MDETTRTRREKKYVCDWPECSRVFACRHDVLQHIREKHTMKKPNKCHLCSANGRVAQFSRPFGLRRHLKNVHKLEDVDVVMSDQAQGSGIQGGDGDALGGQGARFPTLDSTNAPEVGSGLFVTPADGAHGNVAAMEQGLRLVAHPSFARENATVHQRTDLGGHRNASQPLTNLEASSSALSTFGSTTQGVACNKCAFTCVDRQGMLEHMHDQHGEGLTPYCGCKWCKAEFGGREEIQARLRAGGSGIVLTARPTRYASLYSESFAQDDAFLTNATTDRDGTDVESDEISDHGMAAPKAAVTDGPPVDGTLRGWGVGDVWSDTSGHGSRFDFNAQTHHGGGVPEPILPMPDWVDRYLSEAEEASTQSQV